MLCSIAQPASSDSHVVAVFKQPAQKDSWPWGKSFSTAIKPGLELNGRGTVKAVGQFPGQRLALVIDYTTF